MSELPFYGRGVPPLALGALVLGAAAPIGVSGFLLFHTLVEVFTVVVACGIFMVTWNARRFTGDGYLTLIGIAYLNVAVVDLLHTLTYQGMGIFHVDGANVSVQLWVAARYLQSLSLLIAAAWVKRRIPANIALPLYGLVTGVLLLSVFHWQLFPNCFVEGRGLTPFKKYSEFVICLILVGAMVLLARNRRALDPRVLPLFAMSIFATIVSELAFTLYVSVYDTVVVLGHLLKFLSFYLIYKAVVEASLLRPYDTLFGDLKRSEQATRSSGLQLQVILDEMSDGTVVVDRGGVVRYVNHAASALLGADEEDLLGRPFRFRVEAGKSTDVEIDRPSGGKVTARMRVVKTTWESLPAYLVSLHDTSSSYRSRSL